MATVTFREHFKMPCSRHDPLGPVTTDTLSDRPFEATYACSLASFTFPSALNINSNPGNSLEILSVDESVTEFKLHRSLVAA